MESVHKPAEVEATSLDEPADALDGRELLTRLERHAAEAGRLEGRVAMLERALKQEREGRRQLTETLKREREAAKSVVERARRDVEECAGERAELERLRQLVETSEHQVQLSWAQVARMEDELAWHRRPLWRKLLRRPPRA